MDLKRSQQSTTPLFFFKISSHHFILLFLPLLFILITTTTFYLKPDISIYSIQIIFDYLTNQLGWMYLIYGSFCIAIVAWVAFSPLGKIKLGDENDSPDFTTFEWLSLLFCAGIGISVAICGMVESIHYIDNPPYQITSQKSSFVYEMAHMVPLFHWGISAWAIYCVPTIPLAHYYYVMKKKQLSFSTICCNALSIKSNGIIGSCIDLLIVFSILGGVATSLGLIIPLLPALFSNLVGINDSLVLKISLLLFLCIIFSASTSLGIHKGIKKLSLYNAYLAIVFVVSVLLLGPMSFILTISTNSLGLYADQFFRLSFNLDPLKQTNWPQNWTIFYWAWWVAFTPMMAIFVTKISKGRTLKELIIAECIGGTLGCWFILAILGGYSIYLQYYELLDISTIIKKEGIASACVQILQQLPLPKLMISLYLLLAFVFSATSLDSSAYTLASISTTKTSKEKDPSLQLRIFWSLMLTLFSLALLFLGVFKALQLSSLIFSIPMIPITIVCFYFFIKNAYFNKPIKPS